MLEPTHEDFGKVRITALTTESELYRMYFHHPEGMDRAFCEKGFKYERWKNTYGGRVMFDVDHHKVASGMLLVYQTLK